MSMSGEGQPGALEETGQTIVLLGPQGSGKGTQAGLLVERQGFVHLEMGKLLRAAAKEPTPLGRELDRMINQEGKLAPLELAMAIFRSALEKLPKSQSVIFDGTPRRPEEVAYWDEELPKLGRHLDRVIALQLPEDATVERLGKRRICEREGRPLILGVDVANEQSPCPSCGGPILQRADDQPEAIRTRLATYRALTEPVLELYRPRGIVSEVNGDQPIETVYNAIASLLAHEPTKN